MINIDKRSDELESVEIAPLGLLEWLAIIPFTVICSFLIGIFIFPIFGILGDFANSVMNLDNLPRWAISVVAGEMVLIPLIRHERRKNLSERRKNN